MSLEILQKVGKVRARLIAPLWIGGYNASAYSSKLDLVEPIRPYEIKGVLRWMLRILAFSAIYERTGNLEVSRRKAIRFVESILGKASDRSGRSSIFLLRVENPEGGVLPRDLEIQYNREDKQYLILIRSWWRKLYETLKLYDELLKKSMEAIKNKCKNENVKVGINIYCCVSSEYQKDFGGRIEGIMLPIPYIDVSLVGDLGQNESQCVDTKELLRSLWNNSIDKLRYVLKNANILEEHQVKVFEDIKGKLDLAEGLLGKNIIRYQLEPPRNTCFKLLSIGDPRTRLSMLGRDIEGKAERVFMIPPGLEVTIGIYRRNVDIEAGRYVLSSEEISILDDIIIRSLSLALVVKGIGKAVNRGYGSFEIIDIDGKSHNLKTVYDPYSMKEEIDLIKEHIYNIMLRIYKEDRSSGNPSLSINRDRIYIGFIDEYYDIFKSMSFEADNIPSAISAINYMVLSGSHRNIDRHCMAVLGLPRKIKGMKGKRVPSLIRFRLVKCDIDKYCILILYFLTLKNSIINLETLRGRRTRTRRRYEQQRGYLEQDEINRCVRQIFDNICMMLFNNCWR